MASNHILHFREEGIKGKTLCLKDPSRTKVPTQNKLEKLSTHLSDFEHSENFDRVF